MVEVFLVEGIVGSAGAIVLAIVATRPRVRRPRAMPSLARSLRHLPWRHRSRVREIVAMAREHDARHAPGSPDGFTARETLSRYLPETIDAYLATPQALRAVRPLGARSPDEELVRQLFTLRGGLERLREVDAHAAAGRLAANGSFLDERFGPPQIAVPRTVSSLARELIETAFAVWQERSHASGRSRRP